MLDLSMYTDINNERLPLYAAYKQYVFNMLHKGGELSFTVQIAGKPIRETTTVQNLFNTLN